MNLSVRGKLDQVFTAATGLSVVLLTLVLVAILGPMVYRGSGAVFFQGTVEFRKMQRNLFGRGDEQVLNAEVAETEKVRQQVYEMIDGFKKGVDVEALSEQVREIHRQFGQELRDKHLPADQYTRLRELTRRIRDKLEAAFHSQDIDEIKRMVAEVLEDADNPQLRARRPSSSRSRQFLQAAGQIDLSKHQEMLPLCKRSKDSLSLRFSARPVRATTRSRRPFGHAPLRATLGPGPGAAGPVPVGRAMGRRNRVNPW
jgi:hypothetical protein